MTHAPLIFADTETTGLRPRDELWELYLSRHDHGKPVKRLHLFIEHNDMLAERGLPAAMREKYRARWEHASQQGIIVRKYAAAHEIREFFEDDPSPFGTPHLVGLNPAFDARQISRLLNYAGEYDKPWHYHLIDLTPALLHAHHRENFETPIPYRTDDLATALGIAPPTDTERHTAIGDVLWTERIWTRLFSGELLSTGAGHP